MNNEKLFKAQVSIASAYIRAHGQYVQHPEEVAEYAAMVVKLLSENDIESIVLEDEDYED
nr:MAG TPA: hypothetical protein [Caudoviricetes sp.]